VQRIQVVSSDIRSVGYDASTRTLELEFNSGSIYQYAGVPNSIYDGLLAAVSKGSYFHTNIKGSYPYVRVI